ncbi:alpha-(1,3)-fucosyltransferase C-like isoform X2 [Haliotis rubra]|nr:alpha-(1,3)-fucosyltransferase C-like isoform X2 [Haliotis rubra]XP_046582788.1 alpha-(1,3)-fucosyltransferase C-like isoform X2 [Haliotis rubra]XP_046582789.1 alpha-(1,3)-fucosyltransferase C-like isoform X2 [Haliotis rubra]
MNQLTARRHRSRLRSFIFYFIVIVITNVVLLSSLSTLLRPTKEMWLPKFRRKATLKHGSYVQKFPQTRTNLNRTLHILLWTPLFGDPSWAFDLKKGMASCPVSDCVLTSDKSTIAHSHAVVFHAMDLLNYFIGYPMPEYRRTDQVWVLYNIEPPPNIAKDFRSYGGVFNWTLMYRADSDIQLPYFQIEKLPQKLTQVKDIAATKTAGVYWVASNCGDQARRQMVVRELQKHIQVDTYGKCGDYELNNMADTKHYKFYMALENSYCRDYITEKFTGPLRHEQIPIVAGGGDYSKVAPPHSFIDVSDFNTIQELAEYLRYLDKNDTAYNSYFDWHREYHMVRTYQMENLFCDLCEAVHDETRPHQTYTDIQGYIEDDTCQQWTLAGYASRMVQGYAIRLGLV